MFQNLEAWRFFCGSKNCRSSFLVSCFVFSQDRLPSKRTASQAAEDLQSLKVCSTTFRNSTTQYQPKLSNYLLGQSQFRSHGFMFQLMPLSTTFVARESFFDRPQGRVHQARTCHRRQEKWSCFSPPGLRLIFNPKSSLSSHHNNFSAPETAELSSLRLKVHSRK